MCKRAVCVHLLGVLALQPELAGPLAAGVLAAVEVHAPGAAKGEGGAARVRVLSLTCTGSSEGGDSESTSGQKHRP